jgi:hypothetical protein
MRTFDIWEFSACVSRTEFLELNLSLLDGIILTRLFEKALNLYLYLPPHSAHPPGVLKGLIFGQIFQIYCLTMKSSDRIKLVQALFRRLCARGYSADWLRPMFYSSLQTIVPRLSTNNWKKANISTDQPLFAHVLFHPFDLFPVSAQTTGKKRTFLPINRFLRMFYFIHLINVKDPFSHFYLLPKLHKTPWKTRPIISTCSSLLHGLGKWVNLQLQSVIDTLPFVFCCSLDV